MRIKATKQYRKDFKRLTFKETFQLQERLKLFLVSPYDPVLYNHKLTGDLSKYSSFSVTGDIRVHYWIDHDEKGEAILKLVRVGPHSLLYS